MKKKPVVWQADRNGLGELAIFTEGGRHTLSGEGDRPFSLAQRRRNAQLQAAAPDLLGALEEFVEDIDVIGVETMEEEWPDLVITYRRACAAIAKAKRKNDL